MKNSKEDADVCYINASMTVKVALNGHVNSIVPISLVGNVPPEQYFYAFGFGMSGVLLVVSAFLFYLFLGVQKGVLERHRACSTIAIIAAIIAGVGLAVQGCFPLPAELRILTDVEDLRGKQVEFTVWNKIHAIGAHLGFFLGALVHGITATICISSVITPQSLYRKKICLFGAVLGVLNLFTVGIYEVGMQTKLEIVALSQYFAVICLLLYFASYIPDFMPYKVVLRPIESEVKNE